MNRLDGKTIVVIGGTSGIGLAAVRAFLAEGARVVAVGRDVEPNAVAETKTSDRLLVVAADATDPATAVNAIADAQSRFGGFDGLYHVAGGSGRRMGDGPLHEVTDSGWEYTLDQNLTSVFYSNRAAVRAFLERGTAGSILNLSSVLAFSPAAQHFATHSYAAAKAAIIGMTKAAAAVYASRNIRLNALAPALIATPMSQRAAADPAVQDYIRTKQPLEGGRIGQPGDLNGAAIYFLSDESRFVTGQVLAVDGGWCISDGQVSGTNT